jgi:hypothetical protein
LISLTICKFNEVEGKNKIRTCPFCPNKGALELSSYMGCEIKEGTTTMVPSNNI